MPAFLMTSRGLVHLPERKQRFAFNPNSKPSPIEDRLADELYPRIPQDGTWTLRRQIKIDRYTVDFLLEAEVNNDPFPSSRVSVVIECDGHDYHERTKEQAAHDRRRDRRLAAIHSLPTIRFTGSEIHRDPSACADEVIAIVREIGRELLETYRDGIDDGWWRGIEHGRRLLEFDIQHGIVPSPGSPPGSPCPACAQRERIDNERIAAALEQAEKAGV
jgi:very-short-patch-repair endonuclease